MSRAPSLALALTTLCTLACGRDPAQVRWDRAFVAAVDQVEGDPKAAEMRLSQLADKAPRAVDEGAARLELAHLLVDQGRVLEGAEHFRDLAEHARRQDDRARGYYELARLAEREGRLPAAKRMYRSLVRTYPNLMPGERSLAHLFRIARSEGTAAVDTHLAWTRSLAETLAGSELADNLLYQAADESQRRALVSQSPAAWARTEALYRRLADGPHTPLWNDAVWELSWIYHQQHRYPEEIAAIETIVRTRAAISLFGQDEHPYYWQGQLRIARVLLVELAQPARAMTAYLRYAELFPMTIKKDDVRFFALCAALQAGSREDADGLAALIQKEHPDSRFLRRIAPAFTDPQGPHCLPPEVER